jgi:hypothetical protein
MRKPTTEVNVQRPYPSSCVRRLTVSKGAECLKELLTVWGSSGKQPEDKTDERHPDRHAEDCRTAENPFVGAGIVNIVHCFAPALRQPLPHQQDGDIAAGSPEQNVDWLLLALGGFPLSKGDDRFKFGIKKAFFGHAYEGGQFFTQRFVHPVAVDHLGQLRLSAFKCFTNNSLTAVFSN